MSYMSGPYRSYNDKRYVTYTLGGIKEQHAHASPVNKLVSARKRVVRVGKYNLND